jgi:hypothetical protein
LVSSEYTEEEGNQVSDNQVIGSQVDGKMGGEGKAVISNQQSTIGNPQEVLL